MEAGIASAARTAACAAVTAGEAAVAPDADGDPIAALGDELVAADELELEAELHAATARTAAARPTPASLVLSDLT
jgi:hypothetical protein